MPPLLPPPSPPRMAWDRLGYVLLFLSVGLAASAYLLLSDPLATPDESEVEALIAREQARTASRVEYPATFSFWVDSNPDGAAVLVDGDSAGFTPAWVRGRAAGEHHVSVRHVAYPPRDTVVVLGEGLSPYVMVDVAGPPPAEARERVPLPARERPAPPSAATPAPVGAVTIASAPAGALVRVAGRERGYTPLLLEGLAAGPLRATLSREGYADAAVAVEVEAGASHRVDAALAPLPGALEVLVQPWGSIYIDGKLHRRDTDVRYRTEMPAGRHLVRVVHPLLGAQEQVVNVRPGEAIQTTFVLSAGSGSSPP